MIRLGRRRDEFVMKPGLSGVLALSLGLLYLSLGQIIVLKRRLRKGWRGGEPSARKQDQ